MAQLSTKVKLYCEANSKVADFSNNVILQDDSDGNGPYIKSWNIEGLAKPTDEQLASYETAGNTAESNALAISNRVSEYPSLGDVVDAIFKKEAGDSTEFDALATARAAVKSKYTKG